MARKNNRRNKRGGTTPSTDKVVDPKGEDAAKDPPSAVGHTALPSSSVPEEEGSVIEGMIKMVKGDKGEGAAKDPPSAVGKGKADQQGEAKAQNKDITRVQAQDVAAAAAAAEGGGKRRRRSRKNKKQQGGKRRRRTNKRKGRGKTQKRRNRRNKRRSRRQRR